MTQEVDKYRFCIIGMCSIISEEYFGKILSEKGGQLPLKVQPELQVRRRFVRISLIILQLLSCISQEGEHSGRGDLR